MTQAKFVHGGEWVSVRNFMNKHFAAAGPCSICKRISCATVWYSINTKEVRCKQCFDPWKGTA